MHEKGISWQKMKKTKMVEKNSYIIFVLFLDWAKTEKSKTHCYCLGYHRRPLCVYGGG
jgi:hypothetical protein